MIRPSRRHTVAVGAAVLALAATALAVAPAATAAAHTPFTGVVTGTVTAIGPAGMAIPVPGVTVYSNGSQRTTTGASGRYRLTVPAFGETRVCFLVPPAAQRLTDWGFVSHCHGSQGPIADDIGTPFDLAPGATVVVDDVLPAAAGIRGTVVDAANAPVAGVTVYASNDADPARTTTSASGAFVIRGAFQGSSPVCVVATTAPATATNPGIAPVCTSVNAPAGQVTTVTVKAPKGGGVRGAVVDAHGAPVEGATVDAGSGSTTQTAGDGTFTVPHLAKGPAHVCVTPPTGVNLLPTCSDVTVKAGQYTSTPVTLPTGAALTGVVTDAKGNPLSDVAIRLDSRVSQTTLAVTDTDGRYRVVAQQPRAAAVCFVPLQTVQGGTSPNGYVAACTNPVDLVAGVTTASRKLAPSAAVSGQAVDDVGRAVAGADVSAIQFVGEGEVPTVGRMTTDAEGDYTVRNLVPGDYNVEGAHPSAGLGAPAGYTPSAPDNEVTVKGTSLKRVPALLLARAAGLDLLVTGPSNEPISGASLVATAAGTDGTFTSSSDGNGRATFVPVPVDTFHVCVEPLAARPGYPDGLAQKCVDVTTTQASVTRQTIKLALGGD